MTLQVLLRKRARELRLRFISRTNDDNFPALFLASDWLKMVSCVDFDALAGAKRQQCINNTP
jgi:hypothetical protein